jgi:hypothetical protein
MKYMMAILQFQETRIAEKTALSRAMADVAVNFPILLNVARSYGEICGIPCAWMALLQ